MEWDKTGKQIINFQKTIFENSFKAACIFQEQAEKLLKGYLDQSPWITSWNKELIDETLAFTKSAREEFKKTIEKGYKEFDAFFA